MGIQKSELQRICVVLIVLEFVSIWGSTYEGTLAEGVEADHRASSGESRHGDE